MGRIRGLLVEVSAIISRKECMLVAQLVVATGQSEMLVGILYRAELLLAAWIACRRVIRSRSRAQRNSTETAQSCLSDKRCIQSFLDTARPGRGLEGDIATSMAGVGIDAVPPVGSERLSVPW